MVRRGQAQDEHRRFQAAARACVRDRARTGVCRGVLDREVDAADGLRRPGGAGPLSGPLDQGGGAASGDRARQPHRVGKNVGYVVDYYGVGEHLKEALAAYSGDDLEGLLQSIADELPKLADRRQRVRNLFLERGVDRFDAEDDVEACVTASGGRAAARGLRGGAEAVPRRRSTSSCHAPSRWPSSVTPSSSAWCR